MAEPGATLLLATTTTTTTTCTTTDATTLALRFDALYQTEQKLRSGSYGTVYVCHHRRYPANKYAVKVIDRLKLKRSDDASILHEATILKEIGQLNLPHIIRLVDFFREPSTMYMVLILAEGGDVFERLSHRVTYTENDARDLARILLQVIDNLHSVKPYPIIHRDLKPENLLLKDKNEDTSVLLADFGFARHVDQNMCRTRCGTPAYVAPEVIMGLPYSCPADLWSVGCIIFMIIGGYPPFRGENHRELFRKVRASDFTFHEAYWKNVSADAKNLISNLLTVRPDVRLTAAQALQSDWFEKRSSIQLRSTDLSTNLDEMRKFNPVRTLQAAVHAMDFIYTAKFFNKDSKSFSHQMASWDNAAAASGDITSSAREQIIAKLPMVKFADMYDLKIKLRKGSYATVWECEHKQTKDVFAVKIINRKTLGQKDDEAVLREATIMHALSGNKYVVQLMDFYEEDDYFYLVMEYMKGGDVFDRVVEFTHYTEKDAHDLVLILLKAVASIHKQGFAHRDIKPQNLLLRSMDSNSAIKIGDFGFTRRVHTPNSLTSRVGTPTYVAPEILKNIPHDQRVDLWSIGVVAFVLLVGYPPFLEEKQADLFRDIRNGSWEFNMDDWRHISEDAKEFIRGLLVVDPKDRWTMEDALRSRWMQQDPARLSRVDLSHSLRVMKEKKKTLKAIARAFMWTARTELGDVAQQVQEMASGLMEI